MPQLQIRSASSVDQRRVFELVGASYYRFCTQGDSWFSIGSNDLLGGNLLTEMEFSSDAVAIDASKWGRTLSRMVVYRREKFFERLLIAKGQWKWDAILMSCGGNDLIDAAQVRAHRDDGNVVSLSERIMRRREEWGDVSMGPTRFLSEQGWLTFETYFKTNLSELLKTRDKGESVGRPLFFHGYGFATPRPAPLELPGLTVGPWLHPAMRDYEIPKSDYIPLSRELITRFNKMGKAIAADGANFSNVHFLDTTAIPLKPAQLDTGGRDGDWENEIHLTKKALGVVANEYVALIERVLKVQGRTHL